MPRPLDGIKVLDLSKVLAGPLCAQYLGDLGAEVIKVEAVGHGDETRGWPPFPAAGLGTVFLSANRNKRSIAIDMKSGKGRKLVHELAKSADVAIESFGTGVAERLGIDAVSLCALNDRLVHCSISGFGRTGPLKNSPGYDVILQAFSGIMSMTGDEGGGYIRSPISPIDQMTGVHAFSGILASLLAREKSGKGAAIQVSLFDTALGLLGYNLQTFWEKGTQPAKCGSSHESLCPYQAFEAADGPIMIGVANDNLWRKFCAVAGLNAIVDDPRFRTNADRVRHRAETLQHVQSVIAGNSVAHWNAVLNEVGIPCSPINSLAQLLDHPHTRADQRIMQYDHPAAGRLNCVGHPVTFVGEERNPGLPPPMLGQHTDDVLTEIGLSAASIAELRREQIVG
ncbi:crotonobetainyl-CoA:carnitine CoA-transferase CaiB-like acyl-CoA transferase [Bradyrhizobium macuxiense]|uniref:Crotonobetainyl-CoA:carnitine CoA-transferase CaiB-like acyl-CoA transferase n=1 Tax=Bradyrhizobium macuxiense TaxID=1755647 RepID=A0A560MIQ2_9BRAD|nr:CoA transferase [Bradyrhizobium macuxiense]TWC07252.1 crotonobetainyl-CoA:carnitine CoA-transferase CaiB-like acyl-CoA transferase [Bradyrhizobium macuxiense]